MLVCFLALIILRMSGGKMFAFVFENAWKTLLWRSMLWKGESGGREGLVAAPTAKITMRACFGPVEVVSVKVEERGSQVMDWTRDFWTVCERL
jgi:hypothetical protein